MLFARSDFVVVTVGNLAYVMGGCDGNQSVVESIGCPSITNYFTVYDIAANQWTRLDDAPRARYRYMAGSVGNKIYYIGGRYLNDSIIDVVDVYDIATAAWLPPLPDQNGTTSVSDGSVFVIGTRLYVTGGYLLDYTTLNSTFVLDTSVSTTMFLTGVVATKFVSSGDNGAVSIGNYGYVFGGFSPTYYSFCKPNNFLKDTTH